MRWIRALLLSELLEFGEEKGSRTSGSSAPLGIPRLGVKNERQQIGRHRITDTAIHTGRGQWSGTQDCFRDCSCFTYLLIYSQFAGTFLA
jgi:hypothetical protein